MRKKWIMTAGLYVFLITIGAACGTKEQESQVAVVQETVPVEEGLDKEKAQESQNSQKEQSEKELENQSQEKEQPQKEPENQSQEKEQLQENQQVSDSEPEEAKSAESSSTPQELANLEGNIKSISEGSAVMICAETWEEEGSMFMTGRAPGYETEEDLVSLRFAETAKYELLTVKNGGKNPEKDVSKREAAFSDMKEGMTVSLEGYYEDDIFVVTKAIMYEFV